MSKEKEQATTIKQIVFAKEIDDESATELAGELLEDSCDIVVLHINSPGGSASSSLWIADIIESMKDKTLVIGVAGGQCASGGLLILSACHIRKAFKSTIFMYHPVQFFEVHLGDPQSRRSFQMQDRHYNDKMKYFMRKSLSKMPDHVFEKWSEHEHFFDIDFALKSGLIHKVIE